MNDRATLPCPPRTIRNLRVLAMFASFVACALTLGCAVAPGDSDCDDPATGQCTRSTSQAASTTNTAIAPPSTSLPAPGPGFSQPIAVAMPDLAVTSVAASCAGGVISVKAKITNVGTDDAPLSVASVGAAGTTVLQQVPLLHPGDVAGVAGHFPGVTAGRYKVSVGADATGWIVEPNELDNVGFASVLCP